MTAQTLYNQLVQGTISENKFLYEVRRDPSLTMITKFNSLKDTIQILKSKSIISENKDLTSKFKADKTPEVPKVVSLTIDQVSPHEYSKGINYELDLNYKSVGQNMPKDDELKKSQIKVLKNLAIDPYYYTRKCMSDEEKKLEKANLRPEELGKDMTAKNQLGKGKTLKEGVEELDLDTMPEGQLQVLGQIIEEWGLVESDMEDPEVMEELTDEFQKRWGLEEGKSSKIPTEQEYMNLFSQIYEDIDHADVNYILEKYVPEEIMEDQEIGQIEFFQYVPKNLRRELMNELQKYYNEENDLEEAVAVKDRAGNIQYAKDDSEAADLVNNARIKGVQLTKQSV